MWSLGITCVELGKVFQTGGNIFRLVVFVLSKVKVVQKLRNAETVHPYSIQQSYKVPSSEAQGQSVGLGEKAGRKFSSTGERAPGYPLSPNYF